MAQFEAAQIGARIKRAREIASLTQEEMAALASFSARSLQDYESGKTVPYKHLQEISKLLRKPVDWFLYGDEYEEAQDPTRPGVAEILQRLDRIDDLETELRQVRMLLERVEELLQGRGDS